MDINFSKFQALGNDFLIVHAGEVGDADDLSRIARAICDRHFGAGADGLIVVGLGDEGVDCASRIFNADGSEAEVSGNGTRCVAAWLDRQGLWTGPAVRIRTAAGTKRVARAGPLESGMFEMEMGVPGLSSDRVPMRLAEPRERVVGYPLEAAGQRFRVTATSMGNPHCTILLEDLDAVDIRSVGAAVERHELFPERTNVEFVQPLAPDRVRVLFWERGVGETMSSGTGASASAVACVLNGRCDRRVVVETQAGELGVHWREADDVVLLTGPARAVLEGRWLG